MKIVKKILDPSLYSDQHQKVMSACVTVQLHFTTQPLKLSSSDLIHESL